VHEVAGVALAPQRAYPLVILLGCADEAFTHDGLSHASRPELACCRIWGIPLRESAACKAYSTATTAAYLIKLNLADPHIYLYQPLQRLGSYHTSLDWTTWSTVHV
jgi:hypothetical protein